MNYIFRDMFLSDIGLTIINSTIEKDNLYAKVPNTFLILIKHLEAWLQFFFDLFPDIYQPLLRNVWPILF